MPQKLLITLLVILMLLTPGAVTARDLVEIEQDIQAKESELSDIETSLEGMGQVLQDQQDKLASITGDLPRLKLQLEQIEQEIAINKLQLTELGLQVNLKELEQEELEIRQMVLVELSYLSWKTGTANINDLLDSVAVKNGIYQSIIISDGHASLEELVTYINDLAASIESFQSETGDLADQAKKLEAEKQQVIEQEQELLNKIEQLSKQYTGAKDRKGTLQSQLDLFYEEQKAILEYESSIENSDPGQSDPNDEGVTGTDEEEEEQDQGGDGTEVSPPPALIGMSFEGRGRDLYQGHGVGMSQFGALGAALAGWDYEQILEFYFPGAQVEIFEPNYQIHVDGYGSMHIEDYVAGAAEVPVTACEDVGLEFDTGNVWRCWPREAIKAQAVAYRTYGIYQTRNGGSICTTTSCQVYNGSQNNRSAADATTSKVLIYNGAPITAVYSSDNNQGGGTAHNDTVWSSYGGDGTAYAYLRSVDDSSFTYNTSWSRFTWHTNSYTFGKLDEMLNYVNENNYFAGSRAFVNDIRNHIGGLQSIELIRDPSGRVKKV